MRISQTGGTENLCTCKEQPGGSSTAWWTWGAMWEKNELNFHMWDFNLSISIVPIELIQVFTAVMVYYYVAFCVGQLCISFASGLTVSFPFSLFQLCWPFPFWVVFMEMHTNCTCLHFAASYRVVRNQGNYGSVSVSWIVDPACTNDIYPEQGIIFFDNLEFSKNITIYSLPDEVIIFKKHT